MHSSFGFSDVLTDGQNRRTITGGGVYARRPFQKALSRAALLVLLILAWPAPLYAEGGKHEEGNLIRITMMSPIIDAGTGNIVRIMPMVIDINIDTPEAKAILVDQMPRIQDAYLQGSYGKITTTWGYDKIQALLKKITDEMVGPDLKDIVHITVRINVKPQ